MNKVAQYLQEHVLGEVVSSADVRKYFSTDGSVLKMTPAVIVYPRNENDVRKITRFTWQLAERGRILPITARGAGTDQSGAALGSGVILSFPAHMNRILELDSKSGVVVVEPGANYGKVQQTLETHDRFLPPYPSSIEYSTIGGAVANNAGGEKSVKYGDTRGFVKSLRVVLANGEVIETGKLSKRDLNKKLGLSSFEGEVYRALDALLEENHEVLKKVKLDVTKNSAGYDIFDVKQKDGSFDLTPLFVGSQGTLGIVTEITLETEPHNPETTLVVGYFDSLKDACKAVEELRKLPDMPSAIEMVDENLLKLVTQMNPHQLRDVIEKPLPKVVLLVEFDNLSDRAQKRLVKKASKIMEKQAVKHLVETDIAEQEKYWKIRQASATIVAHDEGNLKAVPVIEDGIVPPGKLEAFIQGVYELFDSNHLSVAVWGHAGDANLHVQPFLDLSQLGDRQKAFRLMDQYYKLVISLGGSTSGEHGDGRLRAPYLEYMYGNEVYALFQKVKKIFDPYGSLNPGVKIDVKLDDVKALLRQEYTMNHLYQHMPRS
jgi:FAD/FMN-containing dehydrogenase